MASSAIRVNKAALTEAKQLVDKSMQRQVEALKRVLESIAPGESLSERARQLNVSRQTLYDWMSGKSRPNKLKADQLAKLTGIPAEMFRP